MISRHLAAEIFPHDDNSDTGMVDAIIMYPDGRRGALEFTTDTDEVAAKTWARLGNGERHVFDGIGGGWALRVELDTADARTLLRELPALLASLETLGVHRFGRQLFPTQHERVPSIRRLWHLGVAEAVRGGTEFPGSVYLMPSATPADAEPNTIVDWVNGLLAGSASSHVGKTLRHPAEEHHLCIIVPPGVSTASTRVVLQIEYSTPNLPLNSHGLSDVWVLGIFGHGLRWSHQDWECVKLNRPGDRELVMPEAS